jgi:hypothetical protein
MNSKTYPFIVINKNNIAEIRHYASAEKVAISLLGRRLTNIFVIVNEKHVVHLNTLNTIDVHLIQKELEKIQNTI